MTRDALPELIENGETSTVTPDQHELIVTYRRTSP